jgi:DNA mismatch repair protein MutL
MSDTIQLLPDHVANQIAAGEVIQRPASVIKELIENSIDAGADDIHIILKDAGKTLIKVVDNGCGMSPTDARICFERHATSKLKSAEDLFNICTKGFRGEALASIAAIAEVELLTRRAIDEVGTRILMRGSKVEVQEPTQTSVGTVFSINNLFYNVPARRKFLKSNSTEIKHIVNEIQRVALAHSDITFKIKHNDTLILQLDAANIRQRLVNLFGKGINSQLIDINVDTSMAKIKGYVCKPEHSKKTFGEQFFFVNGRFMKHPYFHKAVTLAYDQLLSKDQIPSYFIFFEVEPSAIDVNIHPTKTEIKFEDEPAIWQIIQASIRESLGKFNIVPSIDFDTDGIIDIPVPTTEKDVAAPQIEVNPFFNPFEEEKREQRSSFQSSMGQGSGYKKPDAGLSNWGSMYEGIDNIEPVEQQPESTEPTTTTNIKSSMAQVSQSGVEFNEETLQKKYLQIKGKYIATPVKSGLMLIDQHRAHTRILYDKFIANSSGGSGHSQLSMFPKKVELNLLDYQLILSMADELAALGFEISDLGSNTISLNSYPAECEDIDATEIIQTILLDFKEGALDIKEYINDKLYLSLARTAAIKYGKALDVREMRQIVDELFVSTIPNMTPDNKSIIHIVSLDDLAEMFN